MKHILAVILPAFLAIGAAWGGGAEVNLSDWADHFQNPPARYGMGAYWWWFGPAQTRQEVSRELNVMRDAGISYVLIFPIYPHDVDDPAKGIRNLRYLSPEFLEILKYAAVQAKALGITVDLLLEQAGLTADLGSHLNTPPSVCEWPSYRWGRMAARRLPS